MKPIPIPKLVDHSTALAELTAKRDDLASRLVAKEAEKLAYARQSEVEHEQAIDPADARVAALLGAPPPPQRSGRREVLAQMAEEIRDIKRAVEILEAQISVERTKATSVVLEKVAPEYRRRIRAIVDAFKSVHAANVELRDLTTALEDQGISWSGLGVVAPRSLGRPTDPYSPIAMYLKGASDLGFITRSDIPEGLRQ